MKLCPDQNSCVEVEGVSSVAVTSPATPTYASTRLLAHITPSCYLSMSRSTASTRRGRTTSHHHQLPTWSSTRVFDAMRRPMQVCLFFSQWHYIYGKIWGSLALPCLRGNLWLFITLHPTGDLEPDYLNFAGDLMAQMSRVFPKEIDRESSLQDCFQSHRLPFSPLRGDGYCMHTIIFSLTTAQIGRFINSCGRRGGWHRWQGELSATQATVRSGGSGGWGSSPRGRSRVERSYSTITTCMGRTK